MSSASLCRSFLLPDIIIHHFRPCVRSNHGAEFGHRLLFITVAALSVGAGEKRVYDGRGHIAENVGRIIPY